MLSYKDLVQYFGHSLFEKEFQNFLAATFSDLTEYDILESDYIVSENTGIELGFINDEAIYDEDENIVFEKGNPVFSHFNLSPKSMILMDALPFDLSFKDKRTDIIDKVGSPTRTNEHYSGIFNKSFLINNYRVGDIVISFDYDPENQTLNLISVRCNLLAEHLQL